MDRRVRCRQHEGRRRGAPDHRCQSRSEQRAGTCTGRFVGSAARERASQQRHSDAVRCRSEVGRAPRHSLKQAPRVTIMSAATTHDGAAGATLAPTQTPSSPAPAATASQAATPPLGSAPALPPLTGGNPVLGTVALSLATFMNVLDTSIANVSIPAIAGDLGVSPSQGTWVITSFAVANAISVPLTGWLTQRFGQVRLFTASVLLFVIASWLCGLAPNMGMLIGFRVVQGAVAGPMIPLSQTLLLGSYERRKAGSAMAMWAITVLVAPVVRPLLSRWINDHISLTW